ncbi:hypothetical protein F4823DRAFT_574888 [Ustulina deusta]|nr:hypothetical protein F4823DRAFT_574888 [Ustulina deusta]
MPPRLHVGSSLTWCRVICLSSPAFLGFHSTESESPVQNMHVCRPRIYGQRKSRCENNKHAALWRARFSPLPNNSTLSTYLPNLSTYTYLT